MNMTTRKWQRPLTKAELEAVKASVVEAETPLLGMVNAIVGVFSVAIPEVLGMSWEEFVADDDTSLKPWEYAIPSDQWNEIGETIVERQSRSDPLGATNLMLEWMNKGPSGYDR